MMTIFKTVIRPSNGTFFSIGQQTKLQKKKNYRLGLHKILKATRSKSMEQLIFIFTKVDGLMYGKSKMFLVFRPMVLTEFSVVSLSEYTL